LKLKYLPYQKECIKFVEEHNGYAIIGDECGLGKTIEAIGISDISYPGKYLIVCTKSMKLKWAREIEKWTGKDSYIINGEKQFSLSKNYCYYIINYHILGKENAKDRKLEDKRKLKFDKEELLIKQECELNGTKYKKHRYKKGIVRLEGWWKELTKLNIIGVIPDEAHRLGNPKAIWTMCFVELVNKLKPKVFIPLSGTPIRKRPRNFWTILHLTAPKLFPKEYSYYWHYCEPTIGYKGGWEFNGSSNEKELNEKLKKIMIRRKKTRKEPIFTVIPLELTKLEAKNYNNLSNDFNKILNKKDRKNTLSELKRLAYLAKQKALFVWIDEYLEDHDKLVISVWHKNVMDDLYTKYKNVAVKIDGSISGINRQKAEDSFQKDKKVKLIFIQTEAGGEGLTLTASEGIGIVEMPDTPGQVIQVLSRIDRYGQKAERANVYFPFANGTIENIVADRIEESFRSMSMILDGKESKGIFNYSFDEILLKNLQ
jgi:SNF2 family DNA or RNA helicase